MRKIVKIFSFIIIMITSFLLAGCQTTNKAESYIGSGENFTYSCSYDSTENKTNLTINSFIKNDTIYTIDKITLLINLYKDDVLVKKEGEVTCAFVVKYGDTRSFSLHTHYDNGEVNKVEYISWKASYKSLWYSYEPWFIGTIAVASILIIIFIICMIANDLELDDITDFIDDHIYILFGLLITFIPYLINGLSSGNWSWIIPLIIIGGIVSVLIICLIAFGIKIIITNVTESYGFSNSTDNNDNVVLQDESGNQYTIDDVLDDKEALLLFNKENLVEWCKENEIKGYSKLNKEQLVNLIMNRDNEKKGLKENKQKPSKKSNGIKFEDIAGLDEAKKAFNEKVIMPIKHKDLYEKFNKKVGGGILLYGLPGTGKTMFAEAASNELDALFIPVKCSDIKSKWYGESEQKIKEIFTKARKAKTSIIFFDEFEAIGAKRTDNSDNGNNDLVPEILAEMQGVGTSSSNSVVLVIAATNKPWLIDSAFLRPGRFDEKIYIPLPDFEARKRMFEIQLSKLPHEDNLDYELLANLTEGCNGADIKEVCEKLKMSAINDSIQKGVEQTIGMDDVNRIKDSIKSSVSQDEIDKLYNFQKN